MITPHETALYFPKRSRNYFELSTININTSHLECSMNSRKHEKVAWATILTGTQKNQ